MGYKTSFSPDIAQALQATSTDASSRGSPKHKTFSWDDSISSFYHYFLFPLPLTIALCLSIIYLFGGSEDWSVIAPVIVGGWGGMLTWMLMDTEAPLSWRRQWLHVGVRSKCSGWVQKAQSKHCTKSLRPDFRCDIKRQTAALYSCIFHVEYNIWCQKRLINRLKRHWSNGLMTTTPPHLALSQPSL